MFVISKKISHRFFFSIILLALIPIGITGYVTYLLAERALTSTASQHMTTIAEDHARHLDAWLRERLDDLSMLAKLPSIRDACQDACWLQDLQQSSENYLSLLNGGITSVQARSPSYKSVFIVSPSREILTAARSKNSGVVPDFKGTTVLDRLQQDQDTAFGPIYPDGHESWTMDIAARVRSENGETVAFIVAVLNLSLTIDPIMTDLIGLGQTGETYLVNKDGQMISPSRFFSRADIFTKNLKTYGVRQALEGKAGTAIYENYTEKKVMGAFLWLPSYEWGMLAEMTLDETLWPLKWIKTVALATGALVMLICAVLAYLTSKRVVRPIVDMAYASRRMAEGELEQRVAFSSEDEVGILATNFNLMAQQLSLSVTTLRQKEDSLQNAYNDLMAAQAQLVQSEKMAAIGELVACVAHEMRNPLTSVKLNIQIIGRSLNRHSALFEHYEIAINQVAQLEKMFSDLLNYSRPLILQKSSVSLVNLLNKSLEQLNGEISSRNITVHQHCSQSLPNVTVDPDKIVQVLNNVLKNAVDASPDGDSIDIVFNVSFSGEQAVVNVAIMDHGSGISSRHNQSIFQPFFTTKQKGTGLGLSIVKKIMDAHGGRIYLASQEGEGTSFTLGFQVDKEMA